MFTIYYKSINKAGMKLLILWVIFFYVLKSKTAGFLYIYTWNKHRHLGVLHHAGPNMSWSCHTNTLVKNACQSH